jgi:hypothetical protein
VRDGWLENYYLLNIIARTTRGFFSLYPVVYGDFCAAQRQVCDASGFLVDDPFIGPSPLQGDLAQLQVEVGLHVLLGPYGLAIEGALFTPDTMVNEILCLDVVGESVSSSSPPPDCQENDLVETEGNVIDLSVTIRDRDGNIIPDYGTVVCSTNPCVFAEYRVTAAKGLRALYLGFANAECNVAFGSRPCPAKAELFTRFGNTYSAGATRVIALPYDHGSEDRVVAELRADDGRHFAVKRVHVYVQR